MKAKPGKTIARKPLELNDASAAYVALAPEPSMIRTQIYLTQREYNFLQVEAQRRQEPMAAVIRSMVDEKMELPDDAWTNNPMVRPSPVDRDFNSPADAALNHDHYLYGSPKRWIQVKGKWIAAPPLPDDYYENDESYDSYNRQVRELETPR